LGGLEGLFAMDAMNSRIYTDKHLGQILIVNGDLVQGFPGGFELHLGGGIVLLANRGLRFRP
jgi:hypothetical protein